jgi:hypothetical protein
MLVNSNIFYSRIMVFVFAALLISCGKSKEDKVILDSDEILEEAQHKEQTLKELTQDGRSLVEGLDYYSSLRTNMEQLLKGKRENILNQGNSIAVLSLSLKDSTDNDVINSKPVQARLNALYTMSLRMQDMQAITALSDQMIYDQGDEVVEIFNGLIDKINTVALKSKLESQVYDPRYLTKDSLDKAKSKGVFVPKFPVEILAEPTPEQLEAFKNGNR